MRLVDEASEPVQSMRLARQWFLIGWRGCGLDCPDRNEECKVWVAWYSPEMATADDREKRAHNVQRPSRSSIFSGRAAHRHPYSAAEPLIHFQRPSRSDLYSAAEPLSLRYLAAEPLIHFQRPSRSDPYSAAEPLNLRYLAAEPRFDGRAAHFF